LVARKISSCVAETKLFALRWLLYDNKDPAGQLKWLAEQLLEAEKSNKKVHILAHIPTGSSSCWDIWAKEYRKILHRYIKRMKIMPS
jgi:hypothetical protein